MTRERSGVLPLLIVSALFAVGVGAVVLLRAPGAGGPQLDSAAPGFTLARLDGEGASVSLEELRGRVVFLNFWATWCGPCRDEAPSLERLHEALHGHGFELLGVSIDAPGAEAEIREFQQEFGLGFPILVDPEKAAYRAYGATGVPESFLIDAEGRLIERFIGPRNWDEPRYARAFRRLLGAGAMAESSMGGG